MSAPGPLPEHLAKRNVDEIDEVFAAANPNPSRRGCPDSNELAALARRERPLDDPGYAHIASCSPCYQAMRELAARSPGQRSSRRVPVIAAVAAAVLAGAVGTGMWLARDQPPAASDSGAKAAEIAARRIVLDFRSAGASRSVDASPVERHPELPNERLALTIYLPVGSEPGAYEVRLVDGQNRRHAHAAGAAAIDAGTTALPVTLDLSSVRVGAYKLAVRRQQESWRWFPVDVVVSPATPSA